jgi:hypothetical protein
MNAYPTIDYWGQNLGLKIFAFDKIDGSNIRVEYSQKRGFYKFGTRKMMIDEKNEPFGFVIDLFMKKYEPLIKIFKSKDYRNSLSYVCYLELAGEKSEFGSHDFKNDKTITLTLFDIEDVRKNEFIVPKNFIKHFGEEVDIPRVVYNGNLNKEFIQQVKENKLDSGLLVEGCVCKGIISNRKDSALFMCKIKTNDWFDRLRKTGNQELIEEEINQQNLFCNQ